MIESDYADLTLLTVQLLRTHLSFLLGRQAWASSVADSTIFYVTTQIFHGKMAITMDGRQLYTCV
jgi:hypothetical protein